MDRLRGAAVSMYLILCYGVWQRKNGDDVLAELEWHSGSVQQSAFEMRNA